MTPDEQIQARFRDEVEPGLLQALSHANNMLCAAMWDVDGPLPPDMQDQVRRCWHATSAILGDLANHPDAPSTTLHLARVLTDRTDRLRELFD